MVRAISKNRIITDGTDFYRILGEPYLKPNGTIRKTDLQKLETEEIITMPYNFLADLLKTGRRHLLPPNRGLTVRAMRLIPLHQLEVTLESKELMRACTEQLNKLPENTPKLYQTDGLKDVKYPAHYFYQRTDYYVKEYDGEDEFFGFMILNGDAEMAELGYQCRSVLFSCIPLINLDYHYQPITLDKIKKKHKI